MKRRLRSPPAVAGKSPSSPQLRLVQVDEGVDGLGRRVDQPEVVRPGGLGAADLAPDLVPVLLVEAAEVGLPIAVIGQRQHRADVLLLTEDVPATAHAATLEGALQGGQRRVVVAQAAEVDDVPIGVAVGEVRPRREGLGDRLGDRRRGRTGSARTVA